MANNKYKKRRLLQSFLATLIVGGLLTPVLLKVAEPSPNGFHVDFQTYLDRYAVSLRVRTSNGSNSKVKTISTDDRPAGLFSRNIEDMQLVFTKHPAVEGSDLLFVSSPDRPEAWRWSGWVPALGTLGSLVVTLPQGATHTLEDLTLSANGEKLDLSRQTDSAGYYRVSGDYSWLEDVRVEAEGVTGPPLDSITIIERNPQSIFVKSLSFYRYVHDFRYVATLAELGAEELTSGFDSRSGVQSSERDGKYFQVKPNSPEVVLQYNGKWGDIREAVKGNTVLLRMFIYGGFVAFLAAVFGALFRFVPSLGWNLPRSLRGRLRSLQNDRTFTVLTSDGIYLLLLLSLAVALFAQPRGAPGYLLGIVMAALTLLLLLVLPEYGVSSGASSQFSDLAGNAGKRAENRHRRNSQWGLIVLLGLIAVSTAVQLQGLGEPYMWVDETFSFWPARHILEKGVPVYDSGFEYNRAYLYHWFVSRFMAWFGVTPFAARLPNLLFNAGTMTVIYLMGKRKSTWVGLAAAALWITTCTVLDITRWVRMYPLFWFLFAAGVYLFYRSLVDIAKPVYRLTLRGIDLSFNPILLGFFLPVFLLAIHVHPLAATFLFGLLLFYAVELATGRSRGRSTLAIGVLLLALLAGAYVREGTLNLLDAYLGQGPSWAQSKERGLSDVVSLLNEGIVFWGLVPALFVVALWKRSSDLLRFTAAIWVGGVLFLSAQHTTSVRYVSMLFPFLQLSFVLFFYELANYSTTRFRAFSLLMGVALLPGLAQHGRLFIHEVGRTNDLYAPVVGEFRNTDVPYEKVFDYLSLFNFDERRLLADNHSALILPTYGTTVDAALLRQSRKGVKEASENRMGVPEKWFDQMGLRQSADRTFLVLSRLDPFPRIIANARPYLIEKRNLGQPVVFVPASKPRAMEW